MVKDLALQKMLFKRAQIQQRPHIDLQENKQTIRGVAANAGDSDDG